MNAVLTNAPLVIILLFIPILPNLWAIWHIFRSDFNTGQEKMIWLAVAVFMPILGGIIYIFWGRRRGQRVI
ncbi:MAG: PLDc N-terminal domain-containing protein [Desulfonatronovibrionaceae bacterium]